MLAPAARRDTGYKHSGMRRSGVLIRSSEVVTRRPQQHCSIALWRGYVSAQFYVQEPGHSDAPRFSPSFRTWHFPWEGSEPLDADLSARAALAALRDDLLAAGWTRMRRASFAFGATPPLFESPSATRPFTGPSGSFVTAAHELVGKPGVMESTKPIKNTGSRALPHSPGRAAAQPPRKGSLLGSHSDRCAWCPKPARFKSSAKTRAPGGGDSTPGPGGGSGSARGGMLGLEGVPLASAAPGYRKSRRRRPSAVAPGGAPSPARGVPVGHRRSRSDTAERPCPGPRRGRAARPG
jgi:hypothetical protein